MDEQLLSAEGEQQEVPAEAVQQEVPAEAVQQEVPAEDVQQEVPAEAVQQEVPGEAVQQEVPAEAVQQEVPADGTIAFVPDKQIQEAVPGEQSGPLPAVPVHSAEDPLDSALELPSLFPQEVHFEEPRELPEPTVVKRPVYKKKPVWKKILTAFGYFCRFLLAILLAVCVLAVGLVGYLTVTEYSPAHAETADRGAVSLKATVTGRQLRLVSFNTGYGALGEEADFFMDGGTGVAPESQELVEKNMLGIEGILNRTDADIILLQEVDTDSDRSFHMNQWLQYEYDLEDYESRFALNYSCEYVPYPLPETIGEVNSGIATYSRFDIVSASRYSLPCPFSWPVRVANLKRCMLVTRMSVNDLTYTDEDGTVHKELVVINVHLEAYDDGEGKEAQTKQLLDFVEAEYAKGNYVIVGGDFNQVFPDAQGRYPVKDTSGWEPGVLEELPEGWQYAYDGTTPTCRLLNQPYDPDSKLTQYYVIDGFIVSPNISVEEVETLDEDFLYSDHNPVVIDIILN